MLREKLSNLLYYGFTTALLRLAYWCSVCWRQGY